MVRDHINQDLRCRADSLPLFHGLIDQWLGINIQAVRLFDDRLCLIEKIDQLLGSWQCFLNLPKLCFAETGSAADEVKKQMLQHNLTLLVATTVNVPTSTIAGGCVWGLALLPPSIGAPDCLLVPDSKTENGPPCQSKSLWPSPLCSFVTITAMSPVGKNWAGSMQSEWLRNIFHIPDAARLVTWRD